VKICAKVKIGVRAKRVSVFFMVSIILLLNLKPKKYYRLGF